MATHRPTKTLSLARQSQYCFRKQNKFCKTEMRVYTAGLHQPYNDLSEKNCGMWDTKYIFKCSEMYLCLLGQHLKDKGEDSPRAN